MEPRTTLFTLSALFLLACSISPARAQEAPGDGSGFLGNAFTAFELKPYENFRVVDSSSANAYCTPNLPECRYLSGDRRNRPDTLVRVKTYARRTSETANAMATRLPNDWQHLLLAASDESEQSALVKVTLRNWQGLSSVDALWMSPARSAPAISRFVFYPGGFRQQFECALSMSDANWRVEEFEQQCDRGFAAIAFKKEFLPPAAAAGDSKVVHDTCASPEIVRARTEYAAIAHQMVAATQAHLKALSIAYELKWDTPEDKRNQISARLMDAADDSVNGLRQAALPARDVKPLPVLIGLHRAINTAAQSMRHSFNEYTSNRVGDFISDSRTAAQTALEALAPVKQDANRCPVP